MRPTVSVRALAAAAFAASSMFLLSLAVAPLSFSFGSMTAQAAGSMDRIPTCADVGLCARGEQGVILQGRDRASVSTAMRRGCRVERTLRENVVLRCPEGVPIPNGQPERVLRLIDLFANRQIGADIVQSEGVTGEAVRVAILDTGIASDHPELSARIIAIDNFTSDDITDLVGHGTHVAGIVSGQGVRELDDRGGKNRALGVAPKADLLIGKVCNNNGWCLEGDILAGIEWAVAQNARVINLSLGGGRFPDYCDSDSLARRVNWASRQGVVVVAAAGNSGDAGEGISTPACASGAIAVGAVDANDVRPSWSSYGKALDIVAPGVSILSPVSCQAAGTCPHPAYGWWSGTSMAAPHVAGLAALLLSVDATLSPEAIASLLKETAIDLGPAGFDNRFGHGRIDALAALRALQPAQEEEVPAEETEDVVADDPAQEKEKKERTPPRGPSEDRGGKTSPGQGNRPAEFQDTSTAPSAIPLPSQAAPAAVQAVPSGPRGAPRW